MKQIEKRLEALERHEHNDGLPRVVTAEDGFTVAEVRQRWPEGPVYHADDAEGMRRFINLFV